jgi:hypothetical protein
LNSYVLDAEVQRNDESNASPTSNLDEERMASPAPKSEGDSIDIFRDPPALSPPGPPGQFAATVSYDLDTECVSPALTWDLIGTESSLNVMK